MKALFSYVFSAMAGLCLIGGISILSGGKE
jgi:hypothetical protein